MLNSSAGVPNEVPVFLCLIQPNGMMTKGYHNDHYLTFTPVLCGGKRRKQTKLFLKYFFI